MASRPPVAWPEQCPPPSESRLLTLGLGGWLEIVLMASPDGGALSLTGGYVLSPVRPIVLRQAYMFMFEKSACARRWLVRGKVSIPPGPLDN